MKDFKLIAIRPLEGCDSRFVKILNPNKVYKFYNDFQFFHEKGDTNKDVTKITYTPTIPADLFYVKTKYKKLPVNISAIVGKNGSGKSSIIELLYLSIFQIALKLSLLPETNFDNEVIKFEKKLKVQLFYIKKDEYIIITIINETIKIVKHSVKDFQVLDKKKDIESKDLLSMFYSLVINYSHYSLNSKHIGKWVKNIFHKNDGYQTPIVINPFRDEGNIDIKNEEYLTRSRLISNLLQASIQNQSLELIPNKTADKIKFTLNVSKSNFKKNEKEIENTLRKNRDEILTLIFKTLSKTKTISFFNSNDKILNIALDYLLKKTYSISIKYKTYKNTKFTFIYETTSPGIPQIIFNLSKFKAFLLEIKKDNSHITLKLKQAINFVENFGFYTDKIGKWVSIKDFASELNQVKSRLKSIIDIIPPSFFNFEIKFTNGSLFSSLSSGEKQKIFASTTVVYHLTNLSSVGRRRLVKYKYINVVFDEIELYYHPELQRTFVSDILNSLKNIEIRDIEAINFLFVTHSPFILSDIPSSNVLFLNEAGESNIDTTRIKTFGANIHDLLKQSFFLENGAMGEFAKNKINDTISFLKYSKLKREIEQINVKDKDLFKIKSDELLKLREQFIDDNKEIHKDLISLIAEPILQIKLCEMYDEVFNEKYELSIVSKRILELQEIEKRLSSKFKAT